MSNIVRLFPDSVAQPQVTGDCMDLTSFRVDIIRPVLRVVGFWSMAAENLLVGTALTESNLQYIKQFGSGPALSFFQIEPASYLDVVRYLNLRQPGLRDGILAACYLETFPEPDALIWHLRLGSCVARSLYYRRPEPLPNSADALGLTQYYKKFYNTHKGKATLSGSLPHFERACGVNSD